MAVSPFIESPQTLRFSSQQTPVFNSAEEINARNAASDFPLWLKND
jgi:hypothetical protein